MKKVAIIDYGMGNLDSVARAVEESGGHPVVTNQPGDLAQAQYLILPGVGAFADGMRNIRALHLETVLHEQVFQHGIPLLGICLGMQLLASKGFEGGETPGLGWIAGEVKLLEPDQPGVRVPHIGWNAVYPHQPSPLMTGIAPGRDFYFVHSYHFVCSNPEHVLATTPYCGEFASIVGAEHIFGAQFHPEKSQRFGLQFIRNFLSL